MSYLDTFHNQFPLNEGGGLTPSSMDPMSHPDVIMEQRSLDSRALHPLDDVLSTSSSGMNMENMDNNRNVTLMNLKNENYPHHQPMDVIQQNQGKGHN